MEYNINGFSPVCGMAHPNTVPKEMRDFVLCFETGSLINWHWISGVQANGGGPGPLERESGGAPGDSPSDRGLRL